MPLPLVPIAIATLSGWSIRAYADHNKAVEAMEDAKDSTSAEPVPESVETDADSVWASITNTDGLIR